MSLNVFVKTIFWMKAFKNIKCRMLFVAKVTVTLKRFLHDLGPGHAISTNSVGMTLLGSEIVSV
jgi:hypothetical protein